MKFSIIVVCLNPGAKLNQTLDSILQQTYGDFEVIVKDGGSTDGAVEEMRKDSRICLFREKDHSIYQAMNQAVSHAQGEYVLFLNCGDSFYDNTVLEKAAERIKRQLGEEKAAEGDRKEHVPHVFYGDTYSEKNHVVITSAPEITGFTCYRNIPCHQSCFYERSLCCEKPYEEKYAVRADYDHFLWCYYRAGAQMVHLQMIVSSYEGGGFSESQKNRKRDKNEHREITASYMSRRELLRYRLIMLLTLAPLRRFLAENRFFSGFYHWLKESIYRRKAWLLFAVLLFVIEFACAVWPVGLGGQELYLTVLR